MALPTVKVTQPTTGTTVNTLPNAGQAAKSESLPVTIASDQGALAVTGTFWQATQPISGSITASFSAPQHVIVDSMPGGGSSVDVTDRDARLLGHVSVDNLPSTQAVTGTFWQATQPVSGSVSVSNFPGTQPVSGTFWQATQPVSGAFFQATQPVSLATNTPDVTDRSARLLGHVTVDNASLAVTGTFWQATQPVSGSVSVSNLPATQPVSGTFWQATQPVSIASMPSTPVTGTFWQATQPVSLATNTPDVTDRSARLLGHVTVDNASLAVTGTFFQATQPVSGTVTANAGTNLNTSALALDATITGGTQTTRLTDGTNTTTVKAASTAAIAADKAIVVAVSPNNTVGVTGTFWQATQPVSGTFWQATQPVSIASMPSTPVTGTFWQATQPVSLATNTPDVTDRSARLLGHVTVDNASLAVTGTFWQATQPVSGTVTANAGTNLNTSALALDATITGGTQTTRLTDGTNTATVKAASTAAVAADKAVVVTQSPNNTVGVTGTFWQATQPVSGTFWQATQPISAASLPLPTGAALDATLTGGTARAKLTDTGGTTNATVKAASTAAVATDTSLVVVQNPTQYATTIFRLLSAAATTNSNLVKNAAGRLFKIRGYNAKAAVAYLKLYNKATAPTVGTDTPVVTIPLKASDQFDIDFGALGIGFATGIGIGLTGAVADADTTALVAADVVGLNIFYA
jgi:hypothetical protein